MKIIKLDEPNNWLGVLSNIYSINDQSPDMGAVDRVVALNAELAKHEADFRFELKE